MSSLECSARGLPLAQTDAIISRGTFTPLLGTLRRVRVQDGPRSSPFSGRQIKTEGRILTGTVPPGLGSILPGPTPGLRPGLYYVAAPRLEFAGFRSIALPQKSAIALIQKSLHPCVTVTGIGVILVSRILRGTKKRRSIREFCVTGA
jgi:hypothetical protein